jgi:hypothetical protein
VLITKLSTSHDGLLHFLLSWLWLLFCYIYFYRMHLYVEDELIFSLFFLSCQRNPGKTLLTYAARKGQVAIVDRLLLAGANIECVDKVIIYLLWISWEKDHLVYNHIVHTYTHTYIHKSIFLSLLISCFLSASHSMETLP